MSGTRIRISSAGVTLVLDAPAGRLPSIVHWGAELDGDDPVETLALALATTPGTWNSDVPTRLALLPEHCSGWMGRPGLSGSRDGAGWSPKFTVTGVELDGAPLPDGPETRVDGAARLRFSAADEDAGLGLELDVEVDDAGLVRVRAAVTNAGDDVFRVDGLSLALPVPRVADEILDFAGRWGKERSPQRRRLGVGSHVRENRRGHTGHDSATILHLGVPGFGFAAGEVWAVHTGWSGNHLHYAERLPAGEQVIGGGELLLPGEVALQPGERYESPWVYGSYGDGLDEVASRFHRHLRARPQHPRSPRPVTLNVWEAVYFDHDLDRLVDLAERAADLGVERYVLDDGWFGARRNDHAGLGDWVVSPDLWPNGLHPLIERVQALGMQFGLWVEPEMVNPDSDLARAHPEWILATDHRLPPEARHQQVLNLGIEACYRTIRDQLVALLDEYDIAYLKWDHNRQLIDAGTQPAGRPAVHAQTLAFYRLVDELKARYPGLEIESCAGGGGRIDLGVLERTDRVWVSDCIDPHERQIMHRWTGQLLPPELMGSHIASGTSHTTGRFHDLSFRAATAVFNHLGIEWDLRKATREESDELRVWIEFYKRHRALLHSGTTVRLDHPDDTLTVFGVVAADRSAAIYSHASVGRGVEVVPGAVRFPGLDPARRYRIRPVPTDALPEGTFPPEWWSVEWAAREHGGGVPRYRAKREPTGIVLSGRALGRVGVAAPQMNPDHAVLYEVTAEE